MSGFEDLNIQPIVVPSPDAIKKHLSDQTTIDQIQRADAETVKRAFDKISEIIDQHRELMNDPIIQEKLAAIIDRLEELGHNPLEEEVDPETVH